MQKYFVHYKQKPYRFIGIAKNSETQEEYVVYRCMYPNRAARLWIRPRKMFEENVTTPDGKSTPRFREAPLSEVSALSQRLYLSGSSSLVLQPMDDRDFAEYRSRDVVAYADEKVKSGNWKAEEALEKSEREFSLLLPQGQNTPCHFLFNLVETQTDKKVGSLWVCHKPDTNTIFVYNIQIFESERGRGLGQVALSQVERMARELRADKISLHVFGHNHIARQLYEGFGFTTTNVNMTKYL